LDKQLRRLRSRIAGAAVDAAGHRRFALELRDEMIEWASKRTAEGQSQASVAEELGINSRLLWRWLRRETVVVREVIVAEQTDARSVSAGGRRVVLRGGVEIVGLDLDDVIAIVRALS
jgi:hypothetical protein